MDFATAKGFAVMPTYGRAKTNLVTFFKAAAATNMTVPGYLVIDRSDWEANETDYKALPLPANWGFLVVEGGCCAAATQEAYDALITPDVDYAFWLGDDLVPVTKDWDRLVVEALNSWNCVSTDDAANPARKFNGATAWSGNMLRAVGYWFPPNGPRHFFLDDITEEIGRLTGCWTARVDVLVKHDHASFTNKTDATLDRTNQYWVTDEKAFAKWQETELLLAAERVLALMESKGVKMMRPDIKGVKLMICTPAGDGRFEGNFMRSLMATEKELTQFGATVHFASLPYCSDLVVARAKLLGGFLRSDDDYMLFVDSDQDWSSRDVIAMLMARKEFVAAAGIKKVFPESYAVTINDDHGRATPIKTDPSTGFLEVTGVGMAFVLLSKACVERLCQGYPELAFVGQDGRQDVAVFNPMVVNRRYLSEDYSMCHRWRAIGGKILVMPSINLGHTGSYRWEGAWGSLLEKMQRENVAA